LTISIGCGSAVRGGLPETIPSDRKQRTVNRELYMPNELDSRMKLTMATESASAARNRLYAAKAKKDGQTQLAKLMTAVAAGEQISARRALIYLRGKIGRAESHLEALRQQKQAHASQLYPLGRQTAAADGDRSAEAAFDQFGKVSHNHAAVLGNPDIGTAEHEFYVCQVCGYIALDEVPEKCPVCGAVAQRFQSPKV
jgi:rubrerythrin